MRRKSPSWRWELVQKALEEEVLPADSFCREVYSVMNGTLELEPIIYALDIYENPSYRDTLIAFFLSGANTSQMMQGTRVDADTLSAFEKLFIDINVFRNKMEWRSYAEYYEANCCADEKGREQIKIGVLNGPIGLILHWHIGNEQIVLSDHEILTQQLRLAFVKSMVSRNASVTDSEAKEALKWGQFAVGAALRRSTLKGNTEIETDAIMAIKQRKSTMTIEETGMTAADFLH